MWKECVFLWIYISQIDICFQAVGICQRLCRISGIYMTLTKVRLGTMVARPTPGSNLPWNVRTKDFNIESDGEGQDLGLLEVCSLLFVMFVINRVAIYAERRRLNHDNHGGAVGEWRFNIANSRALPVPRRSPRFLQWTCLQQFQPGESLEILA